MRAMVLRGRDLKIEEVSLPAPGPGQVVGRVLACGICGSDLHYARFAGDLRYASRSERGVLSNADTAAGVVMGHEFVAEVFEFGEGVTGWQKGDRVVSMPILAPVGGKPGQSIGYSSEYPGAYGEFVIMSALLLLRVPDSLPDRTAALTEPCAVALHAVREAALPAPTEVLVMGAGPIGLLTALWLKNDGHRVIISDPAEPRRRLAKTLGVDIALDPTSEGSQVFSERPPEVVFECVGIQGTLQEAMEHVARRGRVIVAGVCMLEDRIRPLLAINKHLTLQFVLGYSADEFTESLAALAEGRIPGERLITRSVSLDELPAAFPDLANPHDCKVVLQF
jgi:2-desacetyl-2-hydroxyethyl bacteriochlorophyllide A dehydrogenase